MGQALEGLDRDRDGRAPKVEVGQITLLGVQAPDIDRDKATTPGRDVHLPTEIRRVAAPRTVAADAAPSPFSREHRKTPETPRSRITAASAPSSPPEAQDAMSTVNARLSETGEVPSGAFRPARRRDFAETTLMDAMPETGRAGSIALGIAISLAAAVVVVWTLRFGPHLRAFEAAVAERPSPPTEPGQVRVGTPPPSRQARLPSARGATSASAEGEPSGPNPAAGPAAREFPAPGETAAARGARFPDGPSATREDPESASREPRVGSSDTTEEEGRRKNQRVRGSGERIGDRNGSFAAAPKRLPPPPIVRGGDALGQPPPPQPPAASGRTVSSEPPRFEAPPPPPPPPAAAPPRAAPANEKPQYDPDSPLPPAAGE